MDAAFVKTIQLIPMGFRLLQPEHGKMASGTFLVQVKIKKNLKDKSMLFYSRSPPKMKIIANVMR